MEWQREGEGERYKETDTKGEFRKMERESAIEE